MENGIERKKFYIRIRHGVIKKLLSIKKYNGVKKLEANITVEASFVMPIVIVTIFALVYLSFFVHDRCRLQGVVDKVLHKATLTIKHEADIRTGVINYEEINDRGVFYSLLGNRQYENRKLENYLQQELKGGLFLLEATSVNAEVDVFRITIEVKATSNLTLLFFQSIWKQFFYTKVISSAPIHNPADTIRYTEVILDTGSSIKGVDDLKEMLENLFGPKE